MKKRNFCRYFFSYNAFHIQKIITHCNKIKSYDNWLKNKKVIQCQKNAQKTQNFQFKYT